jgi:hypothetical protein
MMKCLCASSPSPPSFSLYFIPSSTPWYRDLNAVHEEYFSCVAQFPGGLRSARVYVYGLRRGGSGRGGCR